MKDEKANKIIAEYMGNTFTPFDTTNSMVYKSPGVLEPKEYTKSLDALVPVWVRLNTYPILRTNGADNSINEAVITAYPVYSEAYGSTIQQAAARVTANVIKALDDKG